jgi:hypothetical protein
MHAWGSPSGEPTRLDCSDLNLRHRLLLGLIARTRAATQRGTPRRLDNRHALPVAPRGPPLRTGALCEAASKTGRCLKAFLAVSPPSPSLDNHLCLRLGAEPFEIQVQTLRSRSLNEWSIEVWAAQVARGDTKSAGIAFRNLRQRFNRRPTHPHG